MYHIQSMGKPKWTQLSFWRFIFCFCFCFFFSHNTLSCLFKNHTSILLLYYEFWFCVLWDLCVSVKVWVFASVCVPCVFLWLLFLFVLLYSGLFFFLSLLILDVCLILNERQKRCGFAWLERQKGFERSLGRENCNQNSL